jgi:hypothetical protein
MHLPYNDPLLAAISREKRLITEYDVLEAPGYSPIKELCQERFKTLGVSALPLIFQDDVKGILMVGRKNPDTFTTGRTLICLPPWPIREPWL